MLHTGSKVRVVSAALTLCMRRSQFATQVSEDVAASTVTGDAVERLESHVLVLYTGGTIGMKLVGDVYEPVPFYLPQAIRQLPPLNDAKYIEMFYGDAQVKPFCLPKIRDIEKRVVYWVLEYEPLLDSSDMTFDDWIRIGTDIRKAYEQYSGFVILHGTDTLAYTSSALSFMLENLRKPVIITGAQIPVCEIRSDGRENLVGALLLAGIYDIPEVCVYFNNRLWRGNRTTKVDATGLEAFSSPNMLPLAIMDSTVRINHDAIIRPSSIAPFHVQDNLCRNVGLLRIFPSISINSVRAFLQPPTEGVVLQTFGAGNMPSRRTDIIAEIKNAIYRGCIIINCTQCLKGQVDVQYFTGKILYDVGVIPGSDMTPEAALLKLSYVLGKAEWSLEKKRKMVQENLRGEITMYKRTLQFPDIIPQLAKFLHVDSSKEVANMTRSVFPTLLCYAAQTNDLELTELLVEYGAVAATPDYNRRTALHVAANLGHIEILKYLLKHGAVVDARDHRDDNALICAIRGGQVECIKELRNAGATISLSPTELGIQLCYAASKGDLGSLNAWVAAGADVNQVDYDGRSALHVAVSRNDSLCTLFLLDNGANPLLRDCTGKCALEEAEISCSDSIKKMLKDSTSKMPVPDVKFVLGS
uniref:asparaginase n=1 Tax=Syphacia muris TaxID=451379 RepID=A0A0N5AVI6_9BILA